MKDFIMYVSLVCLNEKTSFKYKKPISKIQNVAGSCATLTNVIIWSLINNLSWQRILKYGYAGVQLCLKSKKQGLTSNLVTLL